MPRRRLFRPEVDREIISLAWPVILGNLLQTITMFVDLLMVGQLGAGPLAAVGLGVQVVFFVWAVIMGLSTGTIAIIARRHGEGDSKAADNVLKQSLVLAIMVGLIVAVLGSVYGGMLLGMFGAESQVVSLGYDYIYPIFLSSPFVFLFIIASSALRGVGDTRTPLYISALINLINFILNYCLIFGNFGFPRLGVQGAGLGTGISFGIAAAIYLLMLSRSRTRIRLRREGDLLSRKTVSSILRIGMPAGVQEGLIQAGFVIYVALIVSFSTETLAAHNIGARIQSLSMMPGFGFAVATTTLVGINLGAKNPQRAQLSVLEGSKLSLITMSACGAIMALLAVPISGLFTSEPRIIDLSADWILLLALGTPAIGVHFTMAGGLQGAGDTKWPLYISFIGLYLTRIPLAYVLGFLTPLGVHGVWLSMPLEYYVRALIIARRFKKGKWKKISV